MTQLSSFSDPNSAQAWRTVNDGVMGGKSQSEFRTDLDGAVFAGRVSPDNGGGFASVRTAIVSGDSEGIDAIELRIRGDGKRYQFRIRTDGQSYGTSYKHSFETSAGEWLEVTLPLAGFRASRRGRLVPGAAPVAAERIRQIGFLISDKQFGPFELEIAAIRGVKLR